MPPVLPRTFQPPIQKKKDFIILVSTAPDVLLLSFSPQSSLNHSPTPAILSYCWYPPSQTTPSDLCTPASIIISSILPNYLATNESPFSPWKLLPIPLHKNRLISVTVLFPINPVPHLLAVLIETKISSTETPPPQKQLPDNLSVLSTPPVITSPKPDEKITFQPWVTLSPSPSKRC